MHGSKFKNLKQVVLKTAQHAYEDVTRSQDNGGAINWPWRNGDAQKKLLEGSGCTKVLALLVQKNKY
jgi:hypothetical protein